jgi:predicted metal-dependent HD superfamily phosphohydrolase
VVTRGAIVNAQRWMTLCQSAQLTPSLPDFHALCRAWDRWPRAYHTLAHLEACLRELDAYRSLAERPSEVELALWFHDAVYKTWRKDNEAKSADWAERFLTAGGASVEMIGRVREMILATTHGNQGLVGDTALVVDIDLCILGKPPATYDAFERQVRREYWWVPKQRFAAGRLAVLESFLARPRIYHHETLAARYEQPARDNLARAIARFRPN